MTPQPLHDDLQPHLHDVPKLGQVLRHPLVFGVPYCTNFNGLYNQQYAAKKEQAEQAKRDGAWSTWITLHERPYRFSALHQVMHLMTDFDFWQTFGWVWTDSENIWQNHTTIEEMLRVGRSRRELMMDDDDRNALKLMDDKLVVHRGHTAQNPRGLSWTLDRDKAVWFAKRFSQKGFVTSGVVLKSNVIAYFSGRNESEIVCWPNDVQNKRRQSVRRT